MPNMTFAVPEDLHKLMRKHKEIKWSHVAREALWNQAEKVNTLKWMDELLKDSKLTEKDVEELTRKIRRDRKKRLELS